MEEMEFLYKIEVSDTIRSERHERVSSLPTSQWFTTDLARNLSVSAPHVPFSSFVLLSFTFPLNINVKEAVSREITRPQVECG
jgi:hypothetical protein